MNSDATENQAVVDDERYVRLAAVLTQVVGFVAQETLLLAQYEGANPGLFAQLWPPSSDLSGDAFNTRVNDSIEHIGGPPEFYLLQEGEEAPLADNYPNVAMREVFSVFSRARTSVIRAELFRAGSELIADQPSKSGLPDDPALETHFVERADAAFWEHAEAAYIRLASYWDRVGQIFDFAFFNIRKFDHNGFTSVMDRIHVNAVPMNASLASHGGWKRLRAFQTSGKDDGLQWLLLRRNLIVHSLHLHPLRSDGDSVFKSQFNHLEVSHRDRLKPQTPREEIALLIKQLNRAAALFDDVLSVLRFAPAQPEKR